MQQSPPVAWDALCEDVRGIVLTKLTLRDLARAAGTCREFYAACLTRTAQERDILTAAGNNAFGKPLMSAMVAALTFSVLGLNRLALICDTAGRVLDRFADFFIISNAGEVNVATAERLRTVWSGSYEGCYCLLKTPSNTPSITAFLRRRPIGIYLNLDFGRWKQEDHLVVRVLVDREMVEAALALLIAIFRGSSQGVLTPYASPPVVEFTIEDPPGGPPGLQDAKDLAAPLMPLVQSMRFRQKFR